MKQVILTFCDAYTHIYAWNKIYSYIYGIEYILFYDDNNVLIDYANQL